MDSKHINMLFRAAKLIPFGSDRVAVDVGSCRVATTAALIEAQNQGFIGDLHIVKSEHSEELHNAIAMSKTPERVHLHTQRFWDAEIGACDFVFIDGDHRWPAVGNTLCALTSRAAVICMHQSRSWPAVPRTWGAKMAADMLRRAPGRSVFEDFESRAGMRTQRGLLVSCGAGVEIPNDHFTVLRGAGYPQFVFIAIPKCASRSMKAFCEANEIRFVGHTRPFSEWEGRRGNLKGSDVLAIIRDPAKRVASAYAYLRQGGMTWHDAKDWKKFCGSFKDFDSFVSRGLQIAAAKQIHFRPQSHWLEGCDGKLTFFRQERLAEDVARFSSRYGFNPELPHKNTSRSDGLPLSAESLEVIREVYAQDYALLARVSERGAQ